MGDVTPDTSGAGEVCIAGALPALILLPLIGPRRNRFDGEWKEERLPSQNNYFKTLGATIMWMSWYGLVRCATVVYIYIDYRI